MAAQIKKGMLIRVIKESLENSLEGKASDKRFPSYLFETKGEILDLNDEYALIQFSAPAPSVWLRIDQLEISV